MKRIITVCALLMCAILGGCASSGTMVSHDASSKIEIGKTTEAQVLADLGRPNYVSERSDGTRILTYTGGKYSTKASTFVPVVGLFAGGANVSSSVVVVTIGKDGIVKDITRTDYSSETKTGS